MAFIKHPEQSEPTALIWRLYKLAALGTALLDADDFIENMSTTTKDVDLEAVKDTNQLHS